MKTIRYPILLLDADRTLFDFEKSKAAALKAAYRGAGLETKQPYSPEILARYSDINESWWRRLERGECTKPQLQIGRFREFFAALGAQADPAAFNWQTFLDQVHQLNDAVFLQLQKVSHKLQGDTLHLYPQQKFTATILERPNNRQLLSRALSGLSLVIHAPGAQPTPAAEDPTLSQISAIMGNVQAVDEDAPF